eukprot:2731817-Ditylum_brightwellii.AAC.1
MMYITGQQVLVKMDINNLGWYNTNTTPNMQWIPATTAHMSETNQTVQFILSNAPYNKYPILVGNWNNYHVLDFADAMPLPGDEAVGI